MKNNEKKRKEILLQVPVNKKKEILLQVPVRKTKKILNDTSMAYFYFSHETISNFHNQYSIAWTVLMMDRNLFFGSGTPRTCYSQGPKVIPQKYFPMDFSAFTCLQDI